MNQNQNNTTATAGQITVDDYEKVFMDLLREHYEATVNAAHDFRSTMQESQEYFSKAESNFFAVEQMTLGWLFAQGWYVATRLIVTQLRGPEAAYRLFKHLKDQALQAAVDATQGFPAFDEEAR